MKDVNVQNDVTNMNRSGVLWERFRIVALFALAILWGGLGCVAMGLALLGCTPAQKSAAAPVVTAVLDGGEAACQQLATQPEPAWVTFSCTAVTIGDGISHVVFLRLPKEHVDALAAASAKKCKPAEGQVSP